MTSHEKKYLALCGGVGGAKLALGLSHILAPEQLTIAVNTGDDFEHLGLMICPDIDTVTYTLADLVEKKQGWGRAEETWAALEQVERLNSDTWFRLGDKDIGLHLVRRSMLAEGQSLSEVTAHIATSFGIKHRIVPMTDDPVRTIVETDQGLLPFQHYFVREQCRPKLQGIQYSGADDATASKGFLEALNNPQLAGIIICPSNPFLSIDPILSLPGMRDALSSCAAPVIAVSPIVGGTAIKGPTAKIMQEMNMAVTQQAVADHYAGLINGLVVDTRDGDSELSDALAVCSCETVMTTLEHKVSLAVNCIEFISALEQVDG